MEFSYQPLPWNIIFGIGSLDRLSQELEKLGLQRALVLSTPAQRAEGQRVVGLLGDCAAGLFDQAAMHVPVDTVNQALAKARQVTADCTVAIGGGSTTGLGKALALKADLKNVVVPTSYAGSEMTNIWGMTENGKKTTGRDHRVVPDLTIYDPQLTLTMPAGFAASSGLNAMAQAAVNIASAKVNPMVELLALEAVRRLASSLPAILENPKDLAARADAQYGACLAGSALGTGSTGLHHKLCHTFGGTFNTPHAETHTVLLPYSIAYNAAATAPGTARLAQALGCDNAAQGIAELARKLGAPSSLRDLGIARSDLATAVGVTLSAPLDNPEPVTPGRLTQLLEHAFNGTPPGDLSFD